MIRDPILAMLVLERSTMQREKAELKKELVASEARVARLMAMVEEAIESLNYNHIDDAQRTLHRISIDGDYEYVDDGW